MTEPYSIHMEPLFAHAELFDVQRLIESTTDTWYNQTLIELGGMLLRLGVMQGEFHWHSHAHGDELFFLLEGEFHIELEGLPTANLRPRQGFVVPAGTQHRPVVPVRSAVLMLEQVGIVPTGTT